MPDTDLHALDVLLKGWRDYLAAMGTPADQFSRDSGYAAGLRVCAGQLADTLAKIRADAEDAEHTALSGVSRARPESRPLGGA